MASNFDLCLEAKLIKFCQAAAHIWVRAGAEGVIITGRRKERLEGTAQSLQDLSQGTTKILTLVADIANEEDMKRVYQKVKQTFGRTADVVMANAAMMTPMKPSAEEEPLEWWKVFVRCLNAFWFRVLVNGRSKRTCLVCTTPFTTGSSLSRTQRSLWEQSLRSALVWKVY